MRDNLTPVKDAWAELGDVNCFCCGKAHEWGFRLSFFHDSDKDAVVSEVAPIKEGMAGWPGIVHGGFSAMLLDEIMVWGVMHFARKISFTGKMDVRYVGAVRTGRPLLLEARPVKLGKRLAKMEGRLLEAESGTLLADGGGTYIIPSLPEFHENFGIHNVPPQFEAYLRG
jgi:uncharacterized protein (TIGR00369 family)